MCATPYPVSDPARRRCYRASGLSRCTPGRASTVTRSSSSGSASCASSSAPRECDARSLAELTRAQGLDVLDDGLDGAHPDPSVHPDLRARPGSMPAPTLRLLQVTYSLTGHDLTPATIFAALQLFNVRPHRMLLRQVSPTSV